MQAWINCMKIVPAYQEFYQKLKNAQNAQH